MSKDLSPEKLIELRNKKGLSQQEVADYVGVSQRSYSMWERGETKPKYSSVIKLLEVLEEANIAKKCIGESKNFEKLYNEALKDLTIAQKRIIELQEELLSLKGNELNNPGTSATKKTVRNAS